METYSALARYMQLSADRENFLEMGRMCAELTIPYLLTDSGFESGGKLPNPWQSVGSKGCSVLAAKLMLSLFPINTSFFKLQINDAEIRGVPGVDATVRSEIDQSLSLMERMIMQQIAETTDRVHLHNAMRHLVVTGNVLVFAGKKGIKIYPLDRFVVSRDGEGNVMEIITKEIVSRKLLPKDFQTLSTEKDVNAVGEDGPKIGVASTKGQSDDAEVYTCVKRQDGQHRWYQECDGKVIPGSESTSPVKTSPWMPLRFNQASSGESYGRGRVEEFIGDLRALDMLSQALVEGSQAAAKVVFLVSPSATTKPQSLARASNGAIIQGRPDDVGVVSVGGKTADFRTVQEQIAVLTRRISEAFLILSVRDSERTTAEEVRMTQQELNEQLGGIYGTLSAELLQPYLNRKLHLLSRNKNIPSLPKGLVIPTVVAGLNGVGRGQDRAALMEFVTTIAQGMGPEVMQSFVNPSEFLKRLATASGIDPMGLIKSEQELSEERQASQQARQQDTLLKQAGQLAKSPIGEQIVNGQTPDTATGQAPSA